MKISFQLSLHYQSTNTCCYNQGDLFSFYELCTNYHWSIEDEKVGLHSFFVTNFFFFFLIYIPIFYSLLQNKILCQVNKNISYFVIQVLSFYPSERLNVEKQLTTSEVQFTGYLSEKELGFINILYGRYKMIANYSFNSLSLQFSLHLF